MNNIPLTPHDRYSGLCNIPEFGIDAKKRLQNAKILIVGMGGLGNPCALYLAAAGIGTLGICEQDLICSSNLSRQILFEPTMVGSPKKEQAIKKLLQINPDVSVEPFEKVTISNIRSILDRFDFVIDATDTVASKLLINDTCIQMNKPLCYAGVIKTTGLCMTILPRKSRCCRCVFPELSSTTEVGQCSQEGIFAPVAGILGLLQATEAIKYFTRAGELLINRIFSIEVLQLRTKKFDVSQKNFCNMCTTQMEHAS